MKAVSPSRTPDEALELEIVLLWKDLLGQDVRVDDNFFDVGGSSLTAILMMAKLGDALDTELRLADLFAAPTPQELSARIRANGQMRESCIYRLNNTGSERTLYCVHAIGGSPVSYLPLVGALETEIAAYGVQSIGLDSDRPPVSDICEMASAYAAELAARQSNRRYVVLGWSFGAYVAFEMAVALAKRNFAPHKVILLDPPVTDPVEPEANEGLDELERLAPGLWGLPVDRAVYDTLDADGRVEYVIRLCLEVGKLSPFISKEILRRRLDVRRANFAASENYRPQEIYHGRLFVINAVDQGGVEHTRTYWRALGGDGVDFFDIPGAHYEIFREPVLSAVRSCVDDLLSAP